MVRRQLSDLGLEPLTARSLVLTALLGSHPPRLPARALVALGTHFGIAEGTVRTALSRMVVAGELETDNGTYTLGARHQRRQATQDAGLRAPEEPWDGSWWFAIVDARRRSIAQRRSFRTVMGEHRMGEVRPDTWLRPANIPGPPPMDGVLVVQGTIRDRADDEVARQVWDLNEIRVEGRKLTTLAEEAYRRLGSGDPEELADAFLVAVATVRFLRSEPQLPRAITGADWPPEDLRAAYERLEHAQIELMTTFLADATGGAVGPSTETDSEAGGERHGSDR